jgi:transposase-like protein
MIRRPRRNHSPAFKAKVTLAATRGEQTLVEFVPADWRARQPDQAVERAGETGIFGVEAKTEPAGPTVDVKTLHAKIGELTLENDSIPHCHR